MDGMHEELGADVRILQNDNSATPLQLECSDRSMNMAVLLCCLLNFGIAIILIANALLKFNK